MIENFDKRIAKRLPNIYGGASQKEAVLLDDGKRYLLKTAEPPRRGDVNTSYTNNVFSEYLGSRITAACGVPAQKVLLGTVTNGNGRVVEAVACEDISMSSGMHMVPASQTIVTDPVSLMRAPANGRRHATLEVAMKILNEKISIPAVTESYFNGMVTDALICNPDRHNGNWGFLINNSGSVFPCPVYDCASSLFFLSTDSGVRAASAEALVARFRSKVTYREQRIDYAALFASHEIPELDAAIRRVVPKVDMDEVFAIVDEAAELIPDFRRRFYKDVLECAYERALAPAYEQVKDAEPQEEEERQ